MIANNQNKLILNLVSIVTKYIKHRPVGACNTGLRIGSINGTDIIFIYVYCLELGEEVQKLISEDTYLCYVYSFVKYCFKCF